MDAGQFEVPVIGARQLHPIADMGVDDDGWGIGRKLVEARVGRGRRRQSRSVHVEAAVVQFQILGVIENVTVVLVGRDDCDGG